MSSTTPCISTYGCLKNPVIEEVPSLPTGTDEPNTVITEHAVKQFGLGTTTNGWLIQNARPIAASQLNTVRQTAATAGMTIESKNDEATPAEVINWARSSGSSSHLPSWP